MRVYWPWFDRAPRLSTMIAPSHINRARIPSRNCVNSQPHLPNYCSPYRLVVRADAESRLITHRVNTHAPESHAEMGIHSAQYITN